MFKKAKHDTTRIKLFLALGDVYEYVIPDSAIFFYQKALNLAKIGNHKTNNSTSFSNQNINFKILSLEAISHSRLGLVQSNQGSYSEAIEYYLKSLKIDEIILNSSQNLFEKQSAQEGISDCYINIGNVHLYQSNYTQAIEFYLKSLKIKEAIKDKKGMAMCYSNIGSIYTDQGNYPKAIEYHLKSLKIKEELKNKKGISACYTNIGNVYYYQGSHTKALEYYLQSLKINEELNSKKGLHSCYTNIGNVHYYQGCYLKAIEYYLKALKISEELKNKEGMSLCYTNIGIAYKEQGLYDKAIDYYLKSLKITEELNDKNGMGLVLGDIAELNISLADSAALSENQRLNYLNKAIEFGTKAMKLAKDINAIPLENGVANALMIAYKKHGNFKKSIEYAEIYITTQDSMFSEEKTKSLAEMGAKYESEKRELTIQKLEKEQLLQNETIARKNAESKKQRILIFSFLAGFIIILVFSIFLYRLFIQKKLANVILSQQKEEILAQRDEIETQRDLVTVQKEHIEEIHKEVTDSINYAERIQRSFLATKELLDENLNSSLRTSTSNLKLQTSNYFVFFKPKDVVSGDFYWAGKLQNGKFALATADSTGHGVPGAIMSILNISSLEKAVESGICEPSEILNHTRKTIIERLKKDGSPEGGKDGMDASLISFDFVNQKLTYSAANNAIWIVRSSKNLTCFQNLSGLGEGAVTQSSGLLLDEDCQVKTPDRGIDEDASANHEQQTTNNELFELSPDKMPVGKHDKDQISFTQHTFQLQKGDVIYTLTDGFPDQFGGPKGKKFMSKNLKELLIANCQLPMSEQQEILEKTLVKWIGDGEQIDDITILGIRI